MFCIECDDGRSKEFEATSGSISNRCLHFASKYTKKLTLDFESRSNTLNISKT